MVFFISGLIFGVILFLFYLWAEAEGVITFVVLCMVGGSVYSCNQSGWYQAYSKGLEAEQAATYKYEATPRVIREADGCKVYTFKAGGNWHYFTRCPANTTTESNRNYSCGTPKAPKTCNDQEVISTSNK